MGTSRYLCDYEAASKLGSGACGDVFKGYYKTDGSLVAVKKFKNGISEREKEILKSISHENIVSIIEVIEEREMPFCQLVGDHPVYKLIVELRNEDSGKFQNIIPVLGSFHTQMSFIIVEDFTSEVRYAR